MTRMIWRAGVAAVLLSAATSAGAVERPFGQSVVAVDDATLSDIRGAYGSPLSTLTVGQMALIQDAVARDDFRMTAGIGATVMENWWFDRAADPVVRDPR